MIETRPFSEIDWYGYAGAESPDEDTPPRIGGMKVLGVPLPPSGKGMWIEVKTGNNAAVILDKSGIAISFYSPGGYCSQFQKSCEFKTALLWSWLLLPSMSFEELQSLGFEFTEY